MCDINIIVIITKLTSDFPDVITISSNGPAGEKYPQVMGEYRMDKTKSAQLRPVYKKTDGDYYIFYNSKFYIVTV